MLERDQGLRNVEHHPVNPRRRSVGVVVVLVLAQHPAGVGRVDDEEPVLQLLPDAADEAAGRVDGARVLAPRAPGARRRDRPTAAP